jgi:hypothetical protein
VASKYFRISLLTAGEILSYLSYGSDNASTGAVAVSAVLMRIDNRKTSVPPNAASRRYPDKQATDRCHESVLVHYSPFHHTSLIPMSPGIPPGKAIISTRNL